MTRFRVPSWLQSPGSAADRKQNNDRRASAGSSRPDFGPESPSGTEATSPFMIDSKLPPTPSAAASLTSLATTISAEAEKLEVYLRAHHLQRPGFGPHDAADFPKVPGDLQESRQRLIQATKELQALVRGPRECVRWGVFSFLDSLSLQIVNYYGIAKLVPLDGTISLSDLGTKTTLNPVNLARVLRHAMTNGIFCEPSTGLIAHTAASRTLAEDEALRDWIGFSGEEVFPAAAHVLDALRAYPEATSPLTTGFNFAFKTVNKESMFDSFARDPARAKRMGGAMASLTGGEGYEPSQMLEKLDFSEINARGGTFVDVGGSHGFVCVQLAKKWDRMKFVTQDLQKTIDSAPKPLCDDASVADRIELQVHDFFQEQPVHGADVYFFRWIFHNHSTPYAVKILKQLVPALKPGARIVINDHCLHSPGSDPPWVEKSTRSMDLLMMALLNAQEREEDEFEALFREADERFRFQGATRMRGSMMSIIEAVWAPVEAPNGLADDDEEEEAKGDSALAEEEVPAPAG